ncbi:MAG: DoxX family protein [Terriglobales bacterium]
MLTNFCNHFRPLGLTLLRLALGVVFLYHGLVKLNALPAWQHNFVHMGFPAYFAYISGPLETVGGGLLILGLFSRIFGLLLAGELLIALVKVHLPSGPITNVSGYQLPMLLSAGAFLIFCFGAGPISFDALLFGNKGGGGGGKRYKAAA